MMIRPLADARFNRSELAGSLGDLGTFVPLLVGMAAQNGLDFAAALLFAGIFNILTGLTFRIPMAVQPMKAIAAIALTEGLSVPQILAAGAMVSAVILVLGLTGGIDLVQRLVPKNVVRGLQLALGLTLLIKGLQMVAGTNVWFGWDSRMTGLFAALLVLLLFFSQRIPAALVICSVGLMIAVLTHPEALMQLRVGMNLPRFAAPTWDDFVTALPKAALPQIPLTTLNSVLAVCALATDLFPDKAPTVRQVSISVGLMNLTACWFGAMPMCHGAGGLAGQYRFGARTNGAIVFLGTVKVAAALLFGASLLALCRIYPQSILGVLLAFSGMELALVCRDQTRQSDAFVMLLTAAGCLGLNHIATGFGLGVAAAWVLQASRIRLDAQQPHLLREPEA